MGGYKTGGGGHVRFQPYPYEKGGGGNLAMLKGGGDTNSFGVVLRSSLKF